MEKKKWWRSNRKIAAKYLEDSRALMADPANLPAAISLLDSALALQPEFDAAMELKCRCLLRLRRFREVAEMLQTLIPSLQSTSPGISPEKKIARCFPPPAPAKKAPSDNWKYSVLGQACFNLGMLEDAMVLLQTFRRHSAARSRKESRNFAGDKFPGELSPSSPAPAELTVIKFLLRRRTAAISAMNAGHYNESARQFSKILDSRRGIPYNFAAGCFLGRAAAYSAAGRVADAIADCNQALALDPTSIPALQLRSDILQSIGFYSESLRDLDHLKLLSVAILRQVAWRRRQGLNQSEVEALAARIARLRRRGGGGEDYYQLLGVRRGCSMVELERAHRVLTLRNSADRAGHFVERVVFAEEARDLEMAREQARMSAMILSRLLQKGFSIVMAEVKKEEEERERERKMEELVEERESEALEERETGEEESVGSPEMEAAAAAAAVAASVFRGVFCRDLAVVGSLLSQAGLHRTIPVKYEAITC